MNTIQIKQQIADELGSGVTPKHVDAAFALLQEFDLNVEDAVGIWWEKAAYTPCRACGTMTAYRDGKINDHILCRVCYDRRYGTDLMSENDTTADERARAKRGI